MKFSIKVHIENQLKSSPAPDAVGLFNVLKVPAGRGLLAGLDVFPEQSLVLPRLEVWKLLELVGGGLRRAEA